MANIKITDLDAYADPKSTDVLPAVDVTNDETKKVSIADLMENAGSGTEALPGIAFDGDPNTGIYRPGADQLAISTAGTQRLLISDTGAVTIPGDLTVQGTTTTIDTTNLIVEDKNIEMGSVTTPTDTTADGGGITLKGATDKTINWVNATDAWTSSERFDFPAGTAAAPSIILNGDVNSGIYQPGADQVAISTGGSGRLFVDASGRVLIGTTNAVSFGSRQVLAVANGVTGGVLSLYNSTTATANPRISSNPTGSEVNDIGIHAASTNGNIIAYTNNDTERLRITSDGKVGVGTTSPSAKLQVGAVGVVGGLSPVAYFVSDTDASGDAETEIAIGQSGTGVGSWVGIGAGITSGASPYFFIKTRPNAGGNSVERLRIDGSGNVGIGTTSPNNSLDVVSDSGGIAVNIRNRSTDDYGYLRFQNNAGSSTQASIGNIGGQLSFETGTTERLRIDSSGRLLVGTSTAAGNYTLQLEANNGSNPYEGSIFLRRGLSNTALNSADYWLGTIAGGSQTNVGGRIRFETDAAWGTNDYPTRITFSTTADSASSPTERMRIDSSGRVGIGTTAPTYKLESAGSNPLKLVNGSTFDIRFVEQNSLANIYSYGSLDLSINTRYSNNILFKTNDAERARIDSSGRLGLGTSSPSERLDVNGNINFTSSNIVGSTTLNISTDTTQAFYYGLKRLGSDVRFNGMKVYNNANGASGQPASRIGFFTDRTGVVASTERLTITEDGKVGIGTTSPSSVLSVAGDMDVGTGNKIKTTSSGGTVQIQGGATFPGGHIILGGGSGNDDIRFGTTGASSTLNERVRIDSSGRLLVGTSSGTYKTEIVDNGEANLAIRTYNNGSQNFAGIRLFKARGSAASPTVVSSGDTLNEIAVYGYDGADFKRAASIATFVDGTPGANNMPGRLVFSTTADGASSPTERMRITNGGSVLIKTTSVLAGRTNTPLQVNHGSSGNGTPSVVIENNGGSGQRNLIEFLGSSSSNQVGLIHHDNSTTTYGTSSDYRLKENVVPLTGAADRLKQLKPSKFNFIANPDKTVDGFLAHEVQEVVPEAAYGEKDGVDDDGKPVYQGIDQSKLVPLLTAALQEALAEIESLKARVTSLEP